MSDIYPDGFEIENLGGNCPIQGEGSWRSMEVYYRSRGDSWSLDAGDGPLGEGSSPECESAGGRRGNGGWMSRTEARDRIAVHAWCWEWRKNGALAKGAGGALFASLLALDVLGVMSSLEAGADPNAPLAPGGPTPLIAALALGCSTGFAPRDPKGAEEDKEASLMRFYQSMSEVQDDDRGPRRLAAVRALLEAGADPNAKPEGWSLSPIHWAAVLPTGQVGSSIGSFEDDPGPDTMAKKAARRQQALQPERLALNPTRLLMEAGADAGVLAVLTEDGPVGAAGGSGLGAIHLAMDSGSMELAEAMAARMGREAERELCLGWLDRSRMEWSMLYREVDKDSAFASCEACRKLVGKIVSGVWDLDWIMGGGLGESACEARDRVKALAERDLIAKGFLGTLAKKASSPRI